MTFVVSVGAFLWSAVTLVVGYGIRGPSILVFLAALYAAVVWLWGHYLSSDHSKRPRTTGGKIVAVLWLVFLLIVLIFLWLFVAAGAGDKLPRWSDFIFMVTLLGLGSYLHELVAHHDRMRALGFWRGFTVTSTAFAASIVWIVWDSLNSGA